MIVKYHDKKSDWFEFCERVFEPKVYDSESIVHYKKLALELAICIVDEETDCASIMWKLQRLVDCVFK